MLNHNKHGMVQKTMHIHIYIHSATYLIVFECYFVSFAYGDTAFPSSLEAFGLLVELQLLYI